MICGDNQLSLFHAQGGKEYSYTNKIFVCVFCVFL